MSTTLLIARKLDDGMYVSIEQVNKLKERLEADNKSLKAKLENAYDSIAFNGLDALKRERRLCRALWIARALRARDIQRWWMAATCAPITERACSAWNIIERKCLKKAEEYK